MGLYIVHNYHQFCFILSSFHQWDFADISQQYQDDDELKWHTAKSNAISGWDDDSERILREVDAELFDGQSSDVASLDFEDEMGFGTGGDDELWYDPETETTSNN